MANISEYSITRAQPGNEEKPSRFDIRKNVDIDKAQKYDQMIINACKEGNLYLIKEYIESGQDVNQFCLSGWTLLLYAASFAQPNIVQYILSIGGNPNLHQEGYTPLMALSISSNASPEKRVECLRYLIEGKADVNAANKLKETSLMYACSMQELDFISELLKYIQNIDFADSELRTALFYAVGSNRYEIVEMMIERGADLTWTNYRGFTAYDCAYAKGFDNLIPLLKINFDEDEKNIIETNTISSWIDLFPALSKINENNLDSDVLSILYGMGLESYQACFCGINLGTFLRLKETDLNELGVDISVHRQRYIDELFRFHKYEWNDHLIKTDKKHALTPFEALIIMGNIDKKLNVMSSSISFSNDYLDKMKGNGELSLDCRDEEKLKIELEKMKISILQMKNSAYHIKTLAKAIKDLNSDLSLPIHIGKKQEEYGKKWVVITIITLASVYYFKLKNLRKVWKIGQIYSMNLANIYNILLNNICEKLKKSSI